MIANTTSYITSPTTVQKACGNCQTVGTSSATNPIPSVNITNTIPTWIYLLIALLIILIVILYVHKEKKSE